jgi:hypothetical protein
MSAGLLTILLGIFNVLTQTEAITGYGWINIEVSTTARRFAVLAMIPRSFILLSLIFYDNKVKPFDVAWFTPDAVLPP